MKKILNIFGLSILIIGFVFMSFPSKSLADTLALSFAQQFEGQNESAFSGVTNVVLDQDGNIYTTGYFGGTVDFDPSANTYNLTSDNNQSSFISILASDGSFIGAYQFENGEENCFSRAYSITLDDQGNIYTTGWFNGTVDFDPSGDTYNLTSSNNSSFISILASDGSFIGAYQFENGENGSSYASSITLDTEGNIYTTGYFQGTVDFDPSEGTYELTSSNGNNSSFISILASDGSFIGAYQFENGENGWSYTSSITLDTEGNIYTTGYFGGTVDFDPGEGEYNLVGCVGECGTTFISKLSSTGSFIGAYQFENGENSWSEAYSITLDTEGNIYTTGRFYGTVDFDPSEETYELTSSNGKGSSFISILASDGSFIGAYQLGNGENGSSYASSITLDSEGNIYTTGWFYGNTDFGNNYEFETNEDGEGDAFILKLDPDGNTIWAGQVKGEDGVYNYSWGQSIVVDNNDNIYIAGGFYRTFDFDPNEDVYELTSSNDSGYVLKLIQQEEEPTPTPTPHRIKSSGSSVSTIAKFLQEQYQRALAVGIDATSYLQALNTYLQSHGL